MKILFAPDSFKGSASAKHITALLGQVTQKHFPGCEMVSVPIGDGGEGTVESLIDVLGGHYAYATVTGPLGEPTRARYGILNKTTAIIEMAQASGLPLIPAQELNPLKASSYGTGELLRHAMEEGFHDIYLLIGGSATNDGGLGAASALGIRFLDKNRQAISPDGVGLSDVAAIDASGLCPEIQKANITIMCDVTNPLLGSNGATYVYGKQKGATPQMQELLEDGMLNYINILENTCQKKLRDIPGTGAAGGIAVPFLAFANVSIRSGIETVLDLIQFDQMLEGVDLVVSGEGRLDGQSACGKVLTGIGEACRRKGIPAVAIAGCMGDGAPLIYEKGITSAIACINNVMTREESFQRTDELFLQAADQMYRFIKLGMNLKINSDIAKSS